VRILVDSNALLWAVGDSPKLSASANQILTDPETSGLISLASIWEIAIKHHTGRLPLPETPPLLFERLVRDLELSVLPIELAHIFIAASLPLHHRDPFDRMLIAQAIIEEVPILSADRHLSRYPVQVLW
jgi:PIN domain nuclease of toxin-antitoxin system